MHDIRFRGKRIDTGEWTEGDLLRTSFYLDDTKHSIIFTDTVEFPRSEFSGANEVVPETVGQHTGFCDENGRDVFEGDIVKGYNFLHQDRTIYKVVYEGNGFYYQDEDDVCWHPDNIDNDVVIGNIHDNPELWEEE